MVKGKGWHAEPKRHSLARRGYKTTKNKSVVSNHKTSQVDAAMSGNQKVKRYRVYDYKNTPLKGSKDFKDYATAKEAQQATKRMNSKKSSHGRYVYAKKY